MSRRNRNHRSTSSDESFSPVAKRTLAAKENQKETLDLVQAKKKYEPTILDILNEDCWRYVFDYVSVRVRSERVSRQWQSKVHNYLRGVRLCIQNIISVSPVVPPVRCREVYVGPVYYIKVIEKFGPTIVAADCPSEIGLRALGKNSPNLEELTLSDAQDRNPRDKPVHFNRLRKLHRRGASRLSDAQDRYPRDKPVHFNRLRKLHLRGASRLNDFGITNLLGYSTLEELKISNNNMITGVCLNDLKSNLKCLHLKKCRELDIDHMLAASHRLADITKLDLNENPLYVLQDVPKILPETPKLEYLGLKGYDNTYDKVVGLVEAICSLKRLKHLSLNNNSCVLDEWLQALGQRCQLQSLDVGRCSRISPAGVEAFCRGASRTLAALGLSYSQVTDEDVVRCITLCPDLELIDLQLCENISRSLPARVAALGRRAITLRLWERTYRDNPITETYSNVVLDWNACMYLLHDIDDF